jgi:DEAD/DEAH box helicase domain-containing protein
MLPVTLAPDVRRQVLHYLGATFNFREKAVEQALQRFLNDPEDGIFKGRRKARLAAMRRSA